MDRTFRKLPIWVALLVLLSGYCAAEAQTPPTATVAPLDLTSADAKVPMLTLPSITPATCTNCDIPAPTPVSSSGLFLPRHTGGATSGCTDSLCGSAGCGEGNCVSGRAACVTAEGCGAFGRLFSAFHNALCCPDPCYEPRWTTVANSGLFLDSARPTTMSRLRWDHGFGMTSPDRGEFFWAKTGPGAIGRPANETRLNYDELSFYQEVGGDKFSFFVQTPYRSLNGLQNGGSGGFGDVVLGTKTSFLDSELLAMAFQFKTSIPSANPANGTGVGHVSLEPSILSTVKLHADAFWQSQLAFNIPIAGTPGTVGTVLHYHNSINTVLFRPVADSVLVGMFEVNGWTFTSGGATDPATGLTVGPNGLTYLTMGPGVRFGFCDKVDFGFGVQFDVTNSGGPKTLFRSELRWRF